jgi:cyanophycinase
MKGLLLVVSIFIFCLSASIEAYAATKLLLIGGGAHPPELISRFVNDAGGSEARILVITWATDDPDLAMGQMAEEFRAVGGLKIHEAPRRPLTSSSRDLFLQSLRGATALYFTGGDQLKIMSVISDPTIRQALIQFYVNGNIVGGTSAGTAIMSPAMFTGHENEVVPGLGLLPGTLIDTHFLVRSRLPRLSAALKKMPRLIGLGIDEGNAIWVSEGNRVEVFGPTYLTVMRTKPDGTQFLQKFRTGQNFNLR